MRGRARGPYPSRRPPLPAPLRPHTLHARAPTGGPRDPAHASLLAPQLRVAPASAQPLPPRCGDAPSLTSRPRHCFSAAGCLGPVLASERGPSPPRSLPRRVLSCPRFPSGWWQSPSLLTETPLCSGLPVFPGGPRSAPAASLSGPRSRTCPPLPPRVPGGPEKLADALGGCQVEGVLARTTKVGVPHASFVVFTALPGKLASNGKPP